MFWSGREVAKYVFPPDDPHKETVKVNPNGVDLRVGDIRPITGSDITMMTEQMEFYLGSMGFVDDMIRGTIEDIGWTPAGHVDIEVTQLKDGTSIKYDFDVDNYFFLHGLYVMRVKEIVKVPRNAMGIAFPRSTMNRLGMIMSQSGVWDSGYEGRGTLTCQFIVPLIVHKNEAFFQLCFADARSSGEYNGHYQGEGEVRLVPL